MSMEHKIRGKKITMEKFDYRLPTVEEPSLLVLNDKCLLKILGYIKPSGNYTALTKVCHRIKRLINKLAISQTKLDVTDWALSGGELSVNRIRNFNEMFNIVCPYVTDIKMFHIRVAYPGFVNIMKKAFCRVKSLDLRKSAVVVEQIPWSFLTQLKSLNLSECCVTDDTVNLIVEQCPMLEDIDLSCNDEITGKHIWKIQKLKSLNLSWCPKLNVKSFNLILRQIPHLKALRLNGCLNLQGSSMALIASSLSHMNTLDLGFANPQCDWIPVLVRVGLSEISTLDISQCPLECKMIYLTLNKSKNLQRLKMNFVKGLEDDFFNNLNLKKLTELSCSSCKNINAMAVIDFISKSPNLSLLDISDCSNISTKTLSTIASIVSKRPKSVDLDLLFAFGKGSKKVPLKMHFCGRK